MTVLRNFFVRIYRAIAYRKFKNISSSSSLGDNVLVFNPDNLIMDQRTNIDGRSIIMNTRAKFIMHKNSGAAMGLTVITGNHMSIVGKLFKDVTNVDKDLCQGEIYDKDIIIDEDVWLGTNVTLLSGTYIKRGAVIGGGSVVRTTIPPYSVVAGNPAKIIGFRFTPEEIIEHEKILYSPDERLSLEILQSNYEKYYISRIKDIRKFIKL